MQIFQVSRNPSETAVALDDARLRKQLMEAAQILRLVMLETGHLIYEPYKNEKNPGWWNHPVTRHYRETPVESVSFLFYKYIPALHREYDYRRISSGREPKRHGMIENNIDSLIPLIKEIIQVGEDPPSFHCCSFTHPAIGLNRIATAGSDSLNIAKSSLTAKWAKGKVSEKPQVIPRWTGRKEPEWFPFVYPGDTVEHS